MGNVEAHLYKTLRLVDLNPTFLPILSLQLV